MSTYDETNPGYSVRAPEPRDPCDTPAYAAWCEAQEAEYLALQAMPRVAGCPAASLNSECEGCQQVKPVLYARDCITLGYAGHPGAEVTVFQVCQECLEGTAAVRER